jgi:hypothetical protein
VHAFNSQANGAATFPIAVVFMQEELHTDPVWEFHAFWVVLVRGIIHNLTDWGYCFSAR